MKIEKSLFKISISETIIFLLFCLVSLNAIIAVTSVLIGKPGFVLSETGWISQLVFPAVYAIMYTSINRNGVLHLTEFDDAGTVTRQIESILLKKGYSAVGANPEDINYTKSTAIGRFFNYFFREDINVKVTRNTVFIFGKRNLLTSIEWNLKNSK